MSLSTMTSALAALAAVLAMALLAGWLARVSWIGRRQAGQRLSLRESLALDPRRRLHLVLCDGRPLLVLTSPHGDQFLGWMPAGEANPRATLLASPDGQETPP